MYFFIKLQYSSNYCKTAQESKIKYKKSKYKLAQQKLLIRALNKQLKINMMESLLQQDIHRYTSAKAMPKSQYYFRKVQATPPRKFIAWVWYKIMWKYYRTVYHIEIDPNTKIGGGLYMGHSYCITVNQKAVLGKNINIHKGVTIGQENRGSRKGVPTIGNNVWIGINAIVVGKITIGDDVMIAPGAYVNCNIPSHSIVIGNPCVVHHRDNATEHYIDRPVKE